MHSHVHLFVTPWTEALQASLSIANFQSLLKLMSFESVMPSNHLILCRPLLLLPSMFSSFRVFSNESVLCIRQSQYWSFSLASFLPMNFQDWSPLGWNGWISLQSKGLSRIFSNTTVQKHQFFGTQLSSQSVEVPSDSRCPCVVPSSGWEADGKNLGVKVFSVCVLVL